MKILYASSEVRPFAVSGGLADVAGSLPVALRKRLVGCRVVLPLYACVPANVRDEMKFITHITVPVAWRRQYCGIFEYRKDGVIYYFLDNQYYFNREGLYGYYDDAERFAFFSRAILEIIPYIDFKPDVIHCNDWQTALTPVYYSAMYAKNPDYQGIKTVLTIHNIQYQGMYGMELVGDVIGLDGNDVNLIEYDACVNFLKGGIECADRVTTVSPTYAKEILDPWFSYGLDRILKMREWKLQGILNGISYDYYNPETDGDIAANFTAEKPAGKKKCKSALLKELGLPETDAPVLGIVSRLVDHKGLDITKCILEELVANDDIKIVVLGTGDRDYEDYFNYLAGKYPDKVSYTCGFFNTLAKKIYAGSDIFLMPSKSEPCGLSQMIALRYGSIPIIRETGGLRDSITDSGTGTGNGFTFCDYNAHELLRTIRRAEEGFADKDGWAILQKRAMQCDFSWKSSANEYIKMYKEILS